MLLLVIGGVAAGLSAAARARRIDPSLEIVVLEKGADISYGACGLPYYLEGRVRRAEELIVHTPEYFRKERNIAVRTGARVVSISHPRREVTLDGGARVPYDRLAIATGPGLRARGAAQWSVGRRCRAGPARAGPGRRRVDQGRARAAGALPCGAAIEHAHLSGGAPRAGDPGYRAAAQRRDRGGRRRGSGAHRRDSGG